MFPPLQNGRCWSDGLVGEDVRNREGGAFVAEGDRGAAADPDAGVEVLGGASAAFAAIRYQCTAFAPSDPGNVFA
ncbi:hypothetical protein ACWGE1_20715 [Streptomyces sp. NPDC054932]